MEQKIPVLSRRLMATKAYAPRVEPSLLLAAIRERRAAVRVKDGSIEAFAALWPTFDAKWWELGTVWVGEGMRGNGVCDEIMAETVALAPHGSHLFLITPVECIICAADQLGFIPVTESVRPGVLRWASEVGIVMRLPKSVWQCEALPKAGERWLLMRE